MEPAAATLDELTAQTAWLRGLARSLVGDRADADDLAQDTYERAATRAPTDGRPLRPWLGRVMINLLHSRRRATRRRAAREQAVGELATAPATPDELASRMETHRMLAGLVLALAPALRDVVLLHYVEGLTSAQIGPRLGIAAGTVRWRLHEAIAQLRTRLDERGPRASWIAALGAFAGPKPAAAAGGKLALAVIAALIVIAAVVLRFAVTSEPWSAAVAPVRTAANAVRSSGPADHAPAGVVNDGSPGLVSAAAPVTGRVVDGTGAPVAGATVEADVWCGTDHLDAPPPVRSAADGTFVLAVEEIACTTVYARAGERFGRSDRAYRFDPRPSGTYDIGDLVVEPDPPLAVRVVDAATGTAISAATIAVDDRVVAVDATGSAEIRIGAARTLAIRAAGYTTHSVALFGAFFDAPYARGELGRLRDELRLVRLAGGAVEVAGIVRGAQGQPLANAVVKLQVDDDAEKIRETTDAGGRFRIWAPTGRDYELTATFRQEAATQQVTAGITQRRIEVELTLPNIARVTGIVLDREGRPAPGARVESSLHWFQHAVAGVDGRFAIEAVSCSGSSLLDPNQLDMFARRDDEMSETVTLTSEPCGAHDLALHLRPAGVTGIVVDATGAPVAAARVVHTGPPSAPHPAVRTDEAGRFAMRLPPGDHQLFIYGTPDEDAEDEAAITVRAGEREVRVVLPPP